MSANLWNGVIVSDNEFKTSVEAQLNNPMFWAKSPLSHYVLFDVVAKIQTELLKKEKFYLKLVLDLKQREDISSDDVAASKNGLIDF